MFSEYNVHKMTQKESIKIWIEGAVDALDTSEKLFKVKKYHHSLFFLHLALEKSLKALYVAKKGEAAPYTHNLVDLLHTLKLKMGDSDFKNMAEISEFNVSARYESHKYKIYKMATLEFTKKWMKIGKKYYDSFLKQI